MSGRGGMMGWEGVWSWLGSTTDGVTGRELLPSEQVNKTASSVRN